MSDHYHQSYHRGSNNRDSAKRSTPSYNGSAHSGKGTYAVRNTSPVSALSDDLSHLNLPSEITVGSTVQCTMTTSGQVLEGDVMAFDPGFKAIILKSSSCSRSSRKDVHILNLTQMKDFKVCNENRGPVPDPPDLNLMRLQNRVRDQTERKKRMVMAFKTGISPEGQKLFKTIGKTIDDIFWKGENIVVLRDVTITPPYKLENVKGIHGSKSLDYICKIVEKHISEQSKQDTQSPRGPDSPAVNNNNNNNKSEGSAPSLSTTPTPSGSSPSNAGAQTGNRTGSSRFDEGKRRPGSSRSGQHNKRDYDSSSKTAFTHSRNTRTRYKR